MARTYTPLRYPGGKAKLYPFVKSLIETNGLIGETYIEPFAGGAGLALKLLFNGDVRRIIINDFDPAIYSLWYSILNHKKELCKLIHNVPITVDEWRTQKNIYTTGLNNNIVAYGFSTLFLNRTNVSGIIKGGIIGGVNQTGSSLIDSRFNKSALIEIIGRIAEKREQIILTSLDAKDFLAPELLKAYRKVFIYCDPPYVKQGSKLYKNSFKESDHVALFEAMKLCRRKWLVTYDMCDLISSIYKNYRRSTININYSAKTVRKAQEYVFFSHNLQLPNEIKLDNIVR